MNFKDKRVAVIGMGRSGLAAAKLLNDLGAEVLVSDRKPASELEEGISQLEDSLRRIPEGSIRGRQIEIETGRHSDRLIEHAQLIVVSPGVSPTIPLLCRARRLQIPIISEIELAYSFLKAPVVAVTGTNGKTTTCSLISQILARDGRSVALGGNTGSPLSSLINGTFDIVVAEISSFQLEGISRFKPYISIILNITPDHLDRYPSFEDYARCKARILANQTEEDFAILSDDDEIVRKLALRTRARIISFSCKHQLGAVVWLGGDRIMARMSGVRQAATRPFERELLSLDDVRIRGPHNVANVMAAAACALILGVEIGNLRLAVREFKGLEHRLEPVASIEGKEFVNDSKATNVDAVVKSLQTFSQPIILIAGGRDKGSDYAPLLPLIKKKVKGLILVGEAKEKIMQALPGFEPVQEARSMDDAVRLAALRGQPGDVILLSPACASYDMFCNFEERGKAFKEAVRRLAYEKGTSPS
jgi:UDP-N-acetylmuramoylalanine--D-glutamate ligase